jgi:hypothetical protein
VSDDKSGTKPKTLEQLLAIMRDQEVEMMVRFIEWAANSMVTATADENASYENGFAALFEHLKPGYGGEFVHEAWRRARAIHAGQAA